MDLGRLVQMIVNQVIRRLVNLGMTKGIDTVANRGKAPRSMTPEERQAAQNTRAAVKRARQAARLTRRMR